MLLFGARISDERCSLWRTDGNLDGTVKVRDLEPLSLTAADGQAFFIIPVEREGWTLWRTDGTAEGTKQLRLWTSPPENFLVVGSQLYFTAREDGYELWTSDGTITGTKQISRFAAAQPFVSPSGGSTAIVIKEAEGSACFLANEGTGGRELWCSDGTEGGTRQVTQLAPDNPFVALSTWGVQRIGGRLLFPANDGLTGHRLWTSDGRPGSTAPLSGCPGGCPVLDPNMPLVRADAKVFFVALGQGHTDPDEPPTTDLWVTDGTGIGTRRVGDLCGSCRVDRMYPFLGKLYFTGGHYRYDLWASDGTPEGTRRLLATDDRSEDVLPHPPIPLGSRALLTVWSSDPGPGVWLSDGTPAGTEELLLLGRNGRGSNPSLLTPTRTGVRFLASSDTSLSHIWESHGTETTTEALEIELYPDTLIAFGDLTLMLPSGAESLWRTDGSAEGTYLLMDEGTELGRPVVLGDRVLFTSQRYAESEASLWVTDGFTAGTRKIATLPRSWLILPGKDSALIVTADGLWSTNGTAEGTRKLPLPDGFEYSEGGVAQLGSVLFFRGTSPGDWERLWRSDGTPGGTGSLAGDVLRQQASFATHAGALYIVASTTSKQVGLFRSDGTDAGTTLLVTAPMTWLWELRPMQFTSAGSLLFFVLDDGRGRELWRTDGTSAGTFLVRDIVSGTGSSEPHNLVAVGDRLYFVAVDLASGNELWESDGTLHGTRLVQDIRPGAISSDPEDLVLGGERLFFSADDGVHGRELWSYSPGAASCASTTTTLCLGGRFRVEADWHVSEAASGRGQAVSLTPDTGHFWFFDQANVEVILKVLDGQGVNGHLWVFYGALSNVQYTLTVTDTQTGASRRYFNPSGRLGSVADTTAFGPLGATVAGLDTASPAPSPVNILMTTRKTRATANCAPSSTRLCVNDGRFAIEARWKDFQGHSGAGQSVQLTGGETGYFWFFDEANVEVVIKVLDGRALNGRFWVFYGALSNVEYSLTVTDTVTGVVKEYTNPSGNLASLADTDAF